MDKASDIITLPQLQANADKNEEHVRALLRQLGKEVSDQAVRCMAAVYGISTTEESVVSKEGHREFFSDRDVVWECVSVTDEPLSKEGEMYDEKSAIIQKMIPVRNACTTLFYSGQPTDDQSVQEVLKKQDANTEEVSQTKIGKLWHMATDPDGSGKLGRKIMKGMNDPKGVEKTLAAVWAGTAKLGSWFKSLLSRQQSQKSSSSSDEKET